MPLRDYLDSYLMRWLTAWMFSAVLAAIPAQARSASGKPSFDCRKAASKVERAICADPPLASLDATLSRRYKSVRAHASPNSVDLLAANQRRWAGQRQTRCADASAACLQAMYQERIDAMDALLALPSETNPDIQAENPAALEGTWQVEWLAPQVEDKALTPFSIFLPPVGSTVSSRLGEWCVTSPRDGKACQPFGLTIVANDRPPSKPTADGSTRLLTRFNGQADFELIARPDQSLVVPVRLCDATAKHCIEAHQLWRPTSSQSRIRLFDTFSPD